MIKILHIVKALSSGGVEGILYNYYSHMNTNNIHFDFIVLSEETGALEHKFSTLNSRITHFSYNNLILLYKETDSYLKQYAGEYIAIHTHIDMQSAIFLKLAKKYNIKIRIAHCHTAVKESKLKRKISTFIGQKLILYYSNTLFACGKYAGITRYGKNTDFYIINNAIDTEKFSFNVNKRYNLQQQLSINEKTFIIGHIGRLSIEKNQEFLIDIFNSFNLNNPNSILIIIGEGKLEKNLKEYSKTKPCHNNIIFTGRVDNTDEYIQLFDCFLLPSLQEGFPVVITEAMASGLHSFVSDNVSSEININNNVTFLPITNTEVWVNALENYVSEYSLDKRQELSNQFSDYSYNITYEADKLYNLYMSLLSKYS